MRSKTIRILALIIVLAMVASPVSGLKLNTVAAQGGLPGRSDLVPTGNTPVEKYSAVDAADVVDKTEVSRYIVLFEGASLSRAKGSAGINSIEGRNYLDSLAVNRQTMLAKAESLLGRSIQVRYIYDVVLNGVSVELSAQEAEDLQSLPGIRKVLKDQTYTIDTEVGPEWIGAGDIWDGAAVPDGIGSEGEGVLVGIIDTGINFDHPSFSDTPADGFEYEWTGDYLGVCAPDGDPDYADACNDKIVGAWSYTTDAPTDFVTPEDAEGHGSHTASTVAGNFVDVNFYGAEVTISGVAPHAQIISYDVCYPNEANGACEGEDAIAATQQAILDGVDVINYSISGGTYPYSDGVELAFLDATAAGITVSTSAGNSGPTAATVAHRSPWLLSTAATTHNRKFSSEVNFSNPLYQGITTLAGEIPFTTDVVDSEVKFAGEDGNPLGCLDPGYTTPNFYDGAIALIKRGTCNFSEKIIAAEAAGASGVLIFTNANPPGAMSVSGTSIPGVMLNIPGTVGDALAAWVASETDETVSIAGYALNDAFADIMADFSSRGPNTTFDVLKPDIAAPGVEILAAVADGVIEPDGETELALYGGTSMASPHDAGSAALLTALHPDWTPAEIKSALMLTAYDGLVKEDKITAADPFDIGAGRIQLELAGLTGLVMDESIDNYEAADPDQGGDVRTLNTASVYDSACVGECSWTRTFTSVADLPATYTVSAPDWITVAPASFTINPGATQEITITADVSSYAPDEWVFANIEFLTDDFHPGEVTELLSENFEVWPPVGWTIDAAPSSCDTWLSTETTEYDNETGGTGFAAEANSDYCGDAMDTWMISPAMDFTGYEALSLQFKSNFWDYGNVDDGYVDVSVDGGTTWTNVLHYEKQDYYGPRTETIDLSAFAGEATVTIRFHYVSPDWDWYWQVDDVIVANVESGASISDVAIPLAVMPAAG
ncbi:MAG TPA: S8 family serine peptidase, partial [Anaerolineaceae bacterium]|nr:S8 family serine peptidase [Anaerolineaceae bacterium]